MQEGINSGNYEREREGRAAEIAEEKRSLLFNRLGEREERSEEWERYAGATQ